MALITLKNVQLSFGGPLLLDGVNMRVLKGERVSILGRNGEGKSTLLKLIAGSVQADSGEIAYEQGLSIAMLDQEVPQAAGRVFDIVAEGKGAVAKLLTAYDHAMHACTAGDEAACQEMMRLHTELDACDGFAIQHLVGKILSKLELNADDEMMHLSGGRKRRVMLAKALLCQPDVLLLDEPTNHLDVASIEWLEQFVVGEQGLTVVFISHDRAFVDKIATRIVELDRGVLRSYEGNFSRYQQLKVDELDAEEKQNALFDKKLAEEEKWIRTGIKARRTRNEGRVRALKQLREEYSARRNQVGSVQLNMQTGLASGKIVFDVKNLHIAFDQRVMVNDFSTTVLRGDRIALIGDNGVGKTTLVRALLGELPCADRVKQGTGIEVAYFDQLRDQLDGEQSVYDNVAGGSDFVEVDGAKKHVVGYLQEFLFSPARIRTPVKALSGGERNRLLLAKLFLKPSNVLVLDEPTNDLDMDTLELLEEALGQYKGTVLLISHDRRFVDRVASSTWVFDGKGGIEEFVGGYSDYLGQVSGRADFKSQPKNATPTGKNTVERDVMPVKNVQTVVKLVKLSYKDQRELEQLPTQLERLEEELQHLQKRIEDGSLFVTQPEEAARVADAIGVVEDQIIALMERWETLEKMQKGLM